MSLVAQQELQPGFLVVPGHYETLLLETHARDVECLQRSHTKELATLRQQYAEESTHREIELTLVSQAQQKLKSDVLSSRKKMVLYKMAVANAEEKAQLLQASLSVSEGVVKQMADERETLLQHIRQLQEQVQALTALCQGQHRAKVAQQGQLNCTDAEKQQLRAELEESVMLSDILRQELATGRETLHAALAQVEDLRQELSARTAQEQTQESKLAALHAECQKLQACLAEEKEERTRGEAHISKVNSDLQTHSTELKLAEERLARARQDSALREEQLLAEFQRRRAADAIVLQELQTDMQRLKEQRALDRREAEAEQQRLQAKLEREAILREALERQCTESRKQLFDEQHSHSTELARMRRQFSDKVIELEHANIAARLTEERLAAAEKRAELRAAQIEQLEAALERNAQSICQHVNNKDAAVASLQEQLDQLRRKLEQKEVELRECQGAHAQQVLQLERRLAQHDTVIREQETHFLQQVATTKDQAGQSEAQLQERISELQASLSSREERIKQLTDGHAAEASQRERRTRQLQTAHAAEVAKLEARIRELEHQLTVMPSPMEPHRNLVRTATAAVDKLMGNLLGGASSRATENTDDDDDDDRGPSADLIFRMSQPLLSQGLSAAPPGSDSAAGAQPAGTAAGLLPLSVAEVQAGAVASGSGRAVPAEKRLEAAVPAVEVAAPAGLETAAASGMEAGRSNDVKVKRASESGADGDGRPAGRGRGRKAAKCSKEKQEEPALPDTGAEPMEVDVQNGESNEAGARPATRAGSRRLAAKAAQQRAKVMAVALADDSDTGTSNDAPGHAAQPDQSSAPPELGPPAAGDKRGRAGGARAGGSKSAKNSKPKGGQHTQESQQPAGGQGASAAMPPSGRSAAATEKPEEEEAMIPATQDADLLASQAPTQPHTSEPLTQAQPFAVPQPPQQHAPAPARAQLESYAPMVTARGGAPHAPLAVPTTSQVSAFSELLRQRDFAAPMNPMVTLNPKVLENTTNRKRLVPYTAVQTWKLVVPSVHKKADAQQQLQTGAKRPLAVLNQGQLGLAGPNGGDAMPPDVFQRAVQAPPAKAGKKGG